MITYSEIKDKSKRLGVPITNIEKDYVMGWLLWAIYSNSEYSNRLILKGGNCLRKVYFPDTRFSDDLDFSISQIPSKSEFSSYLVDICQLVMEQSGIEFDIESIRVDDQAICDSDCMALDARVYFKGFAGDASMTMRVKFDISNFEKIALPLQNHLLIHDYSDSENCSAIIKAYSLEEILAEKLRSWIQRTRARDLFDVVRLYNNGSIPLSKKNIMTAFFNKTIFKNVPIVAQTELLSLSKFKSISSAWKKSIICPQNSFITAKRSIELFGSVIKALFDPQVLEALRIKMLPGSVINQPIPPEIREPIIEAGKARKLISLKYNAIDRITEPYSFKYKILRGRGMEYFYGYDRSRGNTIKSFFLHKIESVSIRPEEYTPRWVVEF